MKRRLVPMLAMLSLLSAALVCAGCGPAGRLPADKPAGQVTEISLETSPSFGDVTEMRRTTLSLSPDGTMRRLVESMAGDGKADFNAGPPSLSEETRRAAQGTFDHIAGLVTSREFMALPEKIEGGIVDGEFQYITVTTEAGSVRKGGLMPSETSRPFDAAYTAMRDAWDQALRVAAAGGSS